jgi:hypothetical protein
MTPITSNVLKVLRLLPRAAFVAMLLAAPLLAMPAARSASVTTIEAPALKKSGAGFVLMVMLQRG